MEPERIDTILDRVMSEIKERAEGSINAGNGTGGIGMRNLIEPEIYKKLLDRSAHDPYVQQLLSAWDRQGGALVDFLAAAVLAMSEQNEIIMDKYMEIVNKTIATTYIIKDKLK